MRSNQQAHLRGASANGHNDRSSKPARHRTPVDERPPFNSGRDAFEPDTPGSTYSPDTVLPRRAPGAGATGGPDHAHGHGGTCMLVVECCGKNRRAQFQARPQDRRSQPRASPAARRSFHPVSPTSPELTPYSARPCPAWTRRALEPGTAVLPPCSTSPRDAGGPPRGICATWATSRPAGAMRVGEAGRQFAETHYNFIYISGHPF